MGVSDLPLRFLTLRSVLRAIVLAIREVAWDHRNLLSCWRWVGAAGREDLYVLWVMQLVCWVPVQQFEGNAAFLEKLVWHNLGVEHKHTSVSVQSHPLCGHEISDMAPPG